MLSQKGKKLSGNMTHKCNPISDDCRQCIRNDLKILSIVDLFKVNLRGKASTMCPRARTFLVVAVYGIFLMSTSQSAPTIEQTLQDYDYTGVKEVSNEVMRRKKNILKSF